MKSIVYGKVLSKKYNFGLRNWFFGNYRVLDEYSASEELGHVVEDVEFISFKKLLETLNFKRELNLEEKIKIDDKEYKIIDKTHNVDGSIEYYINYEEVIEDEESKIEAERKLEIRKAYLKGKSDAIEDLKKDES